MVSRARIFDTRFADELELGHVFSVFRDGRDPLVVTAKPQLHRNMVGEKSYIIVQVKSRSGTVGQMIFPKTSPVFLRIDVPRETSKGGPA